MEAAAKAFGEEPAFARAETNDNYGSAGINTRAYIATKAMAAFIASGSLEKAHAQGVDMDLNEKALVFGAVKIADALISELSKP